MANDKSGKMTAPKTCAGCGAGIQRDLSAMGGREIAAAFGGQSVGGFMASLTEGMRHTKHSQAELIRIHAVRS